MALTSEQQLAIDELRRDHPSWGDRKIAEALGVTHWQIRQDRKLRLEAVRITPPPSEGPKVLFYDIETAPKIGAYWGPEHQTNIAKRLAGTEILSFAARWEGQDSSTFFGAWQSPDWEDGLMARDRDHWLMERLWAYFDEADVVVAHNGNKFDQKKANGRFLRHGMTPPSHYIEVDTLLLSRTFFGLDSHRLDALAAHLGLEGKVSHDGIDLWLEVMLGDAEAQAKMAEYNLRDTDLLDEVFPFLEPWVGFNGKGRKFNRALWEDEGAYVCPNCASFSVRPNGWRETASNRYQSYICDDCGARPSERTLSENKKGVVLK